MKVFAVRPASSSWATYEPESTTVHATAEEALKEGTKRLRYECGGAYWHCMVDGIAKGKASYQMLFVQSKAADALQRGQALKLWSLKEDDGWGVQITPRALTRADATCGAFTVEFLEFSSAPRSEKETGTFHSTAEEALIQAVQVWTSGPRKAHPLHLMVRDAEGDDFPLMGERESAIAALDAGQTLYIWSQVEGEGEALQIAPLHI